MKTSWTQKTTPSVERLNPQYDEERAQIIYQNWPDKSLCVNVALYTLFDCENGNSTNNVTAIRSFLHVEFIGLEMLRLFCSREHSEWILVAKYKRDAGQVVGFN